MKLFAKNTITTAQEVTVQPTTLVELTSIEVDSVNGGRWLMGETDTGTACDWKEVWVY